MGQKINPNGFRLVSTKGHLSDWYANKSNYAKFAEEDNFIRESVYRQLNDFLSIAEIQIQRINPENNLNHAVNVTVLALYPRAKEMYRKVPSYFEGISNKVSPLINRSKLNLRRFTSLLLKRKVRSIIRLLQLKTGKSFYVCFQFLRSRFENARLIARYIATQLTKRTPFRRAMKETIRNVKRTSLKGIKIQISGRLNGIEIARSEWKREGRVPLHTLKANIDYTQFIAETMYGVIGIKIWLFTGEGNIY